MSELDDLAEEFWPITKSVAPTRPPKCAAKCGPKGSEFCNNKPSTTIDGKFYCAHHALEMQRGKK